MAAGSRSFGLGYRDGRSGTMPTALQPVQRSWRLPWRTASRSAGVRNSTRVGRQPPAAHSPTRWIRIATADVAGVQCWMMLRTALSSSAPRWWRSLSKGSGMFVRIRFLHLFRSSQRSRASDDRWSARVAARAEASASAAVSSSALRSTFSISAARVAGTLCSRATNLSFVLARSASSLAKRQGGQDQRVEG